MIVLASNGSPSIENHVTWEKKTIIIIIDVFAVKKISPHCRLPHFQLSHALLRVILSIIIASGKV